MTKGYSGAVARSRVSTSVSVTLVLILSRFPLFALSTTAAAAPPAVAPTAAPPGVTNRCRGKGALFRFEDNEVSGGPLSTATMCSAPTDAEPRRNQLPCRTAAAGMHVEGRCHR